MIMKQSINVNGAPAAVGPYVHAVVLMKYICQAISRQA